MHRQPDQAPLGVGDDMALAAFDLLSGVVATQTGDVHGLCRLASLFGGLKSSVFKLFSASPGSDVFRGAL